VAGLLLAVRNLAHLKYRSADGKKIQRKTTRMEDNERELAISSDSARSRLATRHFRSNPLVISREIRASRPVRHVKAGVTLLHGRVNNLALPTPRVCTSRSPLDPRLRAPRIDLSKYPTYPLNRAGINPRVTTLLRRK